jgi:hypothetical protein
MNTAEYYRERALVCEKIATAATSDEHRQSMLKMGRSWRELADQRERILKGRERSFSSDVPLIPEPLPGVPCFLVAAGTATPAVTPCLLGRPSPAKVWAAVSPPRLPQDSPGLG